MKLIIFLTVISCALCDVSHLLVLENREISTPPPPPKPYAFGYAAGRFPGHIDRTHSEISDGSGVVQGSYSYVDPNHQIRTVDYIADKNGFHPLLNKSPSPLPADTVAVAAAKHRHLQQFNAIAASHQAGTNEKIVVVPVESKAVQYARNRHVNLYQQIAEEHARLAAEIEAKQPQNTVEH